MQSTVGTDSNVLEALEDEGLVSDSFLRLQGEGRLAVRRLPVQAVGELTGRVLIESFADHPREDRSQGEIAAAVQWSNARAVRRLRLECGLRGRDYPDSALRNHAYGWVRLQGAVPLGPRGSLHPKIEVWGLDFRKTARRDRSGLSVDLDYEHPVARRNVAQIGISILSVDHGLESLQLERGPEPGVVRPVYGPDRDDHGREVHVGLRRTGQILLRLRYAYRRQSSNSIDGELRRHEVAWLLGRDLLWGVHGQFYGNLGQTKYTEPLLGQYFVPRVGEIEAGEDDNTLALRLARRIGRGWSIDGRLAWYRNESILIGDYYRKYVWTAGLSWEAGQASGF